MDALKGPQGKTGHSLIPRPPQKRCLSLERSPSPAGTIWLVMFSILFCNRTVVHHIWDTIGRMAEARVLSFLSGCHGHQLAAHSLLGNLGFCSLLLPGEKQVERGVQSKAHTTRNHTERDSLCLPVDSSSLPDLNSRHFFKATLSFSPGSGQSLSLHSSFS